MFREVAIVTYTAAMLGISAATLVNAYSPAAPSSPPPIERAADTSAKQSGVSAAKPKRKPAGNPR